MSITKAVVWFRSDLRIHDNEALSQALATATEVYPIYVFDTRMLSEYSEYSMRRVGKYRCRFMIEAVADLRARLRSMGSDLIVRVGLPEDEIYQLASTLKSQWVFCNRERTPDEVKAQDSLEDKLWTVGQEIRYSRGKMLYYTQDLPFPITHTPDHFTAFRKEVEKVIPVREPIPSPSSMRAMSHSIAVGNIPELADFGWEEYDHSSLPFPVLAGGETAGLDVLDKFVHGQSLMDLSGERMDTECSYLGAYLSLGCLSPKMVYWKAKKAPDGLVDRPKGIFFQLLIRDYLRLQVKKHGSQAFTRGGMRGRGDEHLMDDRKAFQLWKGALTGEPYVDAFMNQIHLTGYMPRIGRLSVAAYLVNQMGVQWQMGAEYFESVLIDYDPCSNWGNWNLVAGVGGEYKDFSQYHIEYQCKKLDPDEAYLDRWHPQRSQHQLIQNSLSEG